MNFVNKLRNAAKTLDTRGDYVAPKPVAKPVVESEDAETRGKIKIRKAKHGFSAVLLAKSGKGEIPISLPKGLKSMDDAFKAAKEFLAGVKKKQESEVEEEFTLEDADSAASKMAKNAGKKPGTPEFKALKAKFMKNMKGKKSDKKDDKKEESELDEKGKDEVISDLNDVILMGKNKVNTEFGAKTAEGIHDLVKREGADKAASIIMMGKKKIKTGWGAKTEVGLSATLSNIVKESEDNDSSDSEEENKPATLHDMIQAVREGVDPKEAIQEGHYCIPVMYVDNDGNMSPAGDDDFEDEPEDNSMEMAYGGHSESVDEISNKPMDPSVIPLARLRRAIFMLSSAAKEAEHGLQKFETGKISRAYEDPMKALLTKYLPNALRPASQALRLLKRQGVAISESVDEAWKPAVGDKVKYSPAFIKNAQDSSLKQFSGEIVKVGRQIGKSHHVKVKWDDGEIRGSLSINLAKAK